MLALQVLRRGALLPGFLSAAESPLCRALATLASGNIAAKYEGALHPETLALIAGQQESPPEVLAAALPYAPNLVLLQHPFTGNKVYLIARCADPSGAAQPEGWRGRHAARQAGALVQLLRPGVVALESFAKMDARLIGEVDVTLPECPPHVHQQLWNMAQKRYERKQQLVQQLEDCQAQLESFQPYDLYEALTRLQELTQFELRQPIMQDAVVDLERGVVNVTQALRVTGGFDQPWRRRPKGFGPWLREFRRVASRQLAELVGREVEEAYEDWAAYRVALRESLPSTRLECFAPNADDAQAFLRRWKLKSLGLGLSQFGRDLAHMTADKLLKEAEKRPAVPEGFNTSLLEGEAALGSWERNFLHVEAVQEIAADVDKVWRFRASTAADRLAALQPPPNLLTVAVVEAELLPYIVERWLGRLQAALAEEAERAAVGRAKPHAAAQRKPSRRRRKR